MSRFYIERSGQTPRMDSAEQYHLRIEGRRGVVASFYLSLDVAEALADQLATGAAVIGDLDDEDPLTTGWLV